jgi:hypothetical protein
MRFPAPPPAGDVSTILLAGAHAFLKLIPSSLSSRHTEP